MESRPDPGVVTTLVLLGGVLVSTGMAALHAGTSVDLCFLIALNLMPYYLLTLVAKADIRTARRRRGFITPVVFSFMAISVTLFLEWGSLYQQTAGAPIYGLFIVPITTILIGGIGCALGWAVSLKFLQPRDRIPAGCCQWCGYDMRGLAEGAVCPECGKS